MVASTASRPSALPDPVPSRVTDRDAVLYDEHWQPVLDAATRRLLDRLEPIVSPWRDEAEATAGGDPSRVATILDLGTGTGALLVGAATRWPGLRYMGLDASSEMVERAVERATEAGSPGRGPAIRWLT